VAGTTACATDKGQNGVRFNSDEQKSEGKFATPNQKEEQRAAADYWLAQKTAADSIAALARSFSLSNALPVCVRQAPLVSADRAEAWPLSWRANGT